MNLYEEFYPLAVELLDEFGTDAQLVKTAPAITNYDPVTDRVTSTTPPQTINVRAVVAPFEWEDDQGRAVTRSTATLLVAPAMGDILKLGDLSYTVGRFRTIAPQGKAILYLAEVS